MAVATLVAEVKLWAKGEGSWVEGASGEGVAAAKLTGSPSCSEWETLQLKVAEGYQGSWLYCLVLTALQ